MAWKIGEAKQHFSEVVRLAEKSPQVIKNRDRVVAVVMSPSDAQQLRTEPTSIGAFFSELRSRLPGGGVELEIPSRTTRPTHESWTDDGPRRHKRRQ
jgi:hypothetical protein